MPKADEGEVRVFLEFQSPQKPKGDCDYLDEVSIKILQIFRSNHPKSRKAIVTFHFSEQHLIVYLVPITPKAERRL